jgi:tetratricopeptide (TPR) repeat protein
MARLAIYHGLRKWDLLAVVAKRLMEWNPKEPGFFIELAYAARRAESIHSAHAILTRGASLHPTDATVQFNLACYEAQIGNLDRAKTHLKRATEIDAKFRLMALEDWIWSLYGHRWLRSKRREDHSDYDHQREPATIGNPLRAMAPSPPSPANTALDYAKTRFGASVKLTYNDCRAGQAEP